MARKVGSQNRARRPELLVFEWMVRRLLLTDNERSTAEIAQLTDRDPSEVRRMVASVRKRYKMNTPKRDHTTRILYHMSRIEAEQKAIVKLLIGFDVPE